MRHLVFFLAVALSVLPAFAQDPKQPSLAESLSFEAPHSGDYPAGWGGGPDGTIYVDINIVHGGKQSARIERHPESPQQFSTITKAIPIDFAGSKIQMRGYLRTEDVSGFVGLWMREDGDSPALAFDNMQKVDLKGTTPWTEYSIELPLNSEAKQLFFGVLVAGVGKAWADDLQLLVDGKAVWDLPKAERPKTPNDLDHKFDDGSGIAVAALTRLQIDNLVRLGKVWGFLKYHHPLVTSGKRQWDYELFRVMPAVLNAKDSAEANHAISGWVNRLGPILACQKCARLEETDLQLRPETNWISDKRWLGDELGQLLESIYRGRATKPIQFYVSASPGVGNPVFEHELPYINFKIPDAGFQLLSLYRFWNIISYWYPYRDIVGENWDAVLADSIPKVALAKDRDSYQLAMLALVARVHDTHANLWSSLAVRPPAGACRIPVTVRFIQKQAVITAVKSNREDGEQGLRIGDVITAIDGVPLSKLVTEWSPFYSDSNDVTRLRDIAAYMTQGACGKASITVNREGQALAVRTTRVAGPPDYGQGKHDLPGDTFRLLSKDVAYLKLSSVKTADAAKYIDSAAGTKGLIVDIRNYPSEFMVFSLGSLLIDKPTEFARFTSGDLVNPGAFHWTPAESLTPQSPHYAGKVVILVDEASMSQSEYTAMAFRAAPRAIVVGSTTAGADGNVSGIPLPGGLQTMISGIGVFYPDKRPTQRIGILPDVPATPTIAGIKAGRDEVLEAGIRQIVGPDVTAEQIQTMAK